MRIVFGTVLSIALLSAQAGPPVGGPRLGYVEENGKLRPVIGLPGAAYLAPAIDAGFTAARIVISPMQDYALAVRPEDGGVSLIRLVNSGGEARPLNVSAGAAGQIAISPRGGAAVIGSDDGRSLALLTGLPDSTPMQTAISPPGDPIRALAVSDDGTILAASASGDGVAIFKLSAAEPQLLTHARDISGIAFIPGSSAAILADRGAGQILRVNAGNGESAVVITQDPALFQPSALAISRSGGRAFVFDDAARALLTVDLTANVITASASCDCRNTRLDAMNGDAVFRLTASPLLLFDGDDSAGARVVVIPGAEVQQ